MEIIHPFIHKHRLELKHFKHGKTIPCSVCRFQITGSAYCCAQCDHFRIHRSCAEFPKEVRSPFHPQHTLTLLALPPYDSCEFECNACGLMSIGLPYHCSECEYDLDVHCAGLIPYKGKPQQFPNLNDHSHPLILCDVKKGFDAFCSCCMIPVVKGQKIYVCLECKVVLDESCARLSQKIQHLFHPQHPLILFSRPPSQHRCNACGMSDLGFLFRCSECDFDLDVRCASLIPISNKNDEHRDKDIVNHRHPLIHCDKTKNFRLHFSCSGCLLPLGEDDYSVYVCLDCMMLLHKSCAHLPYDIVHPFHQTHPLSLLDNITWDVKRELCVACRNNCEGFIYWCRECRIYFHIRCLFPLPPLINSLHKHTLAFLNSENYFLGGSCNICMMTSYIPLFRCVECNFNAHLHCLPELPLTVKHKCHLHRLTLSRSPIKDFEDEDHTAEFYCDACEEHRKLNESTYYCEECHYVSHVRCVISEVWLYLQRVSWDLSVKPEKRKLEIAMDDVKGKMGEELLVDHSHVGDGTCELNQITAIVDDDSSKNLREELANKYIVGDPVIDELIADIALVQIGVDELKAQEEELKGQLEVVTRQLETKKGKLDELKERLDQHRLFRQQ